MASISLKLNDMANYEKINSINVKDDGIAYHLVCLQRADYKAFNLKTKKKSSTQNGGIWEKRRAIHLTSFELITEFVRENIVLKRESYYLKDLYTIYTSIFAEEAKKAGVNIETSCYNQNHLIHKLKQKFGDEIQTQLYKNKNFVFNSELSVAEATMRINKDRLGYVKSEMIAIALHLRKIILNMNVKHIPKQNICEDDLQNGECEVPEELYSFIKTLIVGPYKRSKRNDIRIKTISDNIIFAASGGKIKPATNILLGMVMKSETSSRKVIEILNKLGHSICYHSVEEFETELAYEGAQRDCMIPKGLISGDPNLHTALAFDNYDRFVETVNGKDSMHDTVGIVYQNKSELENLQCQNNVHSDPGLRRRRKYLPPRETVIVPYLNQQKNQFLMTDILCEAPRTLNSAINLNNMWMFSHALNTKDSKRWYEWNSNKHVDVNPIQQIGYIRPINYSPTSNTIVNKNP